MSAQLAMQALYAFDYKWAPPPTKPQPQSSYEVHEMAVLQAQVDRDFALDESAKMAAAVRPSLRTTST